MCGYPSASTSQVQVGAAFNFPALPTPPPLSLQPIPGSLSYSCLLCALRTLVATISSLSGTYASNPRATAAQLGPPTWG